MAEKRSRPKTAGAKVTGAKVAGNSVAGTKVARDKTAERKQTGIKTAQNRVADSISEAPRGGQRRTPKFRRRSDARPDEVLDAALELFIDKGYAATRVDDIAKKAGISKGAVYLYFPSKEALLEGLVKRAIVPVADNALAVLASVEGNPREMMTLFMRMLASRAGESKLFAIPKIIMREAVVAPQIAAIYRKEVLDRALPVLTGIIAKGIASGHFRKVDPEMAVRSVMGPIGIHIVLAEVFGIKSADDLGMEDLMDTHLTILFDGLSAPEGGE